MDRDSEPASACLPASKPAKCARSVQSVSGFTACGLPMDEEAGPGSHELPGLIGRTSHRYSNQPTISFSKAPKGLEKIYISKGHEREALGRESPGPGAHSLLNASFGRAAPRVAMGTGKARYLECFENLKTRSPGPIYSYDLPGEFTKPQGTVIFTKATFPKASRNANSSATASPSPSQYTPFPAFAKTGGVSMQGKSGEGHLYLRNIEGMWKGKDSPGPASHVPLPKALGRSFKFASVGRDGGSRKESSPGPGSYHEEQLSTSRTHSKKSSFGTSPRKFDPRKRNRYAVAKSFDLVRFAG